MSDIGPVNTIDNTITLRISEEDEEITFIDEFCIILDGHKLHPETGAPFADKVAKIDQIYLTVNSGESYEFSFKLPRSFAGKEQGDVSVVASGFYAPLEPQISGKTRIGNR